MKRIDMLRVLTDIGLKRHEAQIYLATLQLGTAPVARISEASGVARSFCYQAIQDLVNQGFLAAAKTASTQHYTALPIDALYQRQQQVFHRRALKNRTPPGGEGSQVLPRDALVSRHSSLAITLGEP